MFLCFLLLLSAWIPCGVAYMLVVQAGVQAGAQAGVQGGVQGVVQAGSARAPRTDLLRGRPFPAKAAHHHSAKASKSSDRAVGGDSPASSKKPSKS